jgi:hypothetical protein
MISSFKIENPSDHRSASTSIIIWRTDALGCDLEHSKAHRWTHHWGMGKPLGLYSEVPQDGRLVHHLEFYYRLNGAVRGHIDAKATWFSSQEQNDEQFKLEPTRSTTFKLRLKLRAREEVKFVSSTIIVSYLVWMEQYMASMQIETLPSTNCHNGSWEKVTLAGQKWCFDQKEAFSTRILTAELPNIYMDHEVRQSCLRT